MRPILDRRVVVLVVLAACSGGSAVPAASRVVTPDTVLLAPAESTLKQDPLSRSIRRGLALASATRDSLPANVGNDLRCVSCHLDGARRAYAMPWVGAYGRFPQYRSRSGKVARLEDRINDCFRRSLNGRSISTEGDDMRDLVAYISWLSRGTVSGRRGWGNGIDSLAPLVPDTARGQQGFLQFCARCHGPDGQGMLKSGILNAGPPLWGPRSFNIGSGMARVRVAAAFIHRHMPFDVPGTITPQAAFDIAGFVGARPRPDYPGKERDWPNGDAPVDAAYPTTGRVTASMPAPPVVPPKAPPIPRR
ncbi:MAG: c-type cytochrome [Gemmatimonadetes bacterium]|nr:c-type cytochrome [Gemmatimonadota bacterium]